VQSRRRGPTAQERVTLVAVIERTVRTHPMTRRPTTSSRVVSVDGTRARDRADRLVTEEPMEIRIRSAGRGAAPLAVTMRTPGNDFELAAGFCLTEGMVADPGDIVEVAYCLDTPTEQHYNVVTVGLRSVVDLEAHERRFVANASCGLCGKQTLDQLEVACPSLPPGLRLARSVLVSLPRGLREAQAVFEATGGLHAAAVFDTTGSLTALREDVGRHNALDKLIGWGALQRRLPLSDQVLLVSGRLSFEIVQKAAVAGIPLVCAVSAPSSLAVDAARRLGQTVVGFLRDEHFNVYTHGERIDLEA
jgi:FdhD protein